MPPAVHPQTTPGLPQRQQQQPQRYGSSVPTMPPSGPSPTGQNVRRTAPPGPLIEGKLRKPWQEICFSELLALAVFVGDVGVVDLILVKTVVVFARF